MKTAKKSALPPFIFYLVIFAAIIALYIRAEKQICSGDAHSRMTLVIDAGHGGIDSGALSAGGCRESDINLQIALSANELAHFFGVKTIMTRTDDSSLSNAEKYSEHEDLVKRSEIAGLSPNSVLLSIHQNTYPTGQPSGAQVIYANDDISEAWGRHTHANLVQFLDPQNRRVATPTNGKILLLSAAKCPSLLVECGFMSNFLEIEKLMEHEYRLKIAAVLIGSFLQFEFENQYT